MDNRLKYYLQKTKTSPPEMVIKKAFCKVSNKALDSIRRLCADIFDIKMTDADFLKKIWGSKYQFNNSEKLQDYFQERKKPKLLIDSLKKKILFR